jgi:hypothetical protein
VVLDFADTVRPLIPRWWSALLDDVRAVAGTSAGMGRLVVRSTGSTWALSTSHPGFARCPAVTPVATAQLAELAPLRAGVLEPGGWLVLYPASGPAVRTRVAGGDEVRVRVPAIPAAS